MFFPPLHWSEISASKIWINKQIPCENFSQGTEYLKNEFFIDLTNCMYIKYRECAILCSYFNSCGLFLFVDCGKTEFVEIAIKRIYDTF